MSFQKRLEELLAGSNIKRNMKRPDLIQACVDNGEALVSQNGALATWTRPESTGRSPKDTIIVKRDSSAATIDWTAANNIAVDEETFDMLVEATGHPEAAARPQGEADRAGPPRRVARVEAHEREQCENRYDVGDE